MATKINLVAVQGMRRRLLSLLGEYGQATHAGGDEWKVSSTIFSPFHVAVAIEQEFRCQIELCVGDNPWKCGAWRGFAHSHLHFRFPHEVMSCLYDYRPDALPPEDLSGYVYFISDGERVKIGRSVNIESRLNALQTSTAVPLKLLAAIPGGGRERELHRRFAHLRIRGEWFRLGDDLRQFIEESKAEATVNP
jgi:hypothetical protein